MSQTSVQVCSSASPSPSKGAHSTRALIEAGVGANSWISRPLKRMMRVSTGGSGAASVTSDIIQVQRREPYVRVHPSSRQRG